MNEKHGKWAKRACLTACAAIACAGALALYRSGFFDKVRSVGQLQEMIDAAGPMAGAAFFVIQLLTVVFAPVPSNVTMLAGALALGFFEAAILGVLAVTAGSVLMFALARRLGRKAVRRMIDRGVMDRYLPVIEEKQDMFLFLTMLFPFFPDDVLCILAGLTSMPLSRFALITAAARPWGLLFAALLGGGEIRLPVWGWAILIPAMAALFCLAMRYSAGIEEKLFCALERVTGTKVKRKKP